MHGILRAAAVAAPLLASLCGIVGCGDRIDELRRTRPAVRDASPTVVAPPGGRYRSARVRVDYRAGGSTLTSGWSDVVTHTLILGAAAGETSFVLDEFPLGGGPGDSATDELIAMVDAQFTLRFAPDGHALALSTDGGHVFRYAALDAGEHLLYCRRYTFAGEGDDLWASAPTTRAIALEILGTVAPPAVSAHPSADHALTRWEREAEAAAGVVCAHRDDAALALALAHAVVERAHPFWLASTGPASPQPAALACLGDAARLYPAVSRILVDVLLAADREELEGREHAAEALGRAADADTQDVLARVATGPMPAPASGVPTCWLRGKLAWALASVTTRRHAASDAAFTALTALASAPGPCPDEPAGKMARIAAVRGLAALADPRARAALTALAPESCPGELPPWPAEFAYFNEPEGGGDFPIACWARAALARAVP
ncbi:MAG TPA: hypothetical protein VG389_01030 [Myxococcota bacterium]|nr:hypothetical protein [Myxococcota bacterium]